MQRIEMRLQKMQSFEICDQAEGIRHNGADSAVQLEECRCMSVVLAGMRKFGGFKVAKAQVRK